MLWLTWRQHRLQLLTTVLVFGAIAAYLIPASREIVAFANTVDPSCFTGGTAGCGSLLDGRYDSDPTTIKQLLLLSNLLPAIVGAFWGAPLVAREFERGTYRLAWTQGVAPVRWVAVKLVVLVLGAAAGGAAAAVLFGWAVSGWRITGGVHRFREWWVFDLVGVVPILMWPSALLLGVATGLVIRRTAAAMAVSLVLFGALIVGLAQLRAHYATPEVRPAGVSAAAAGSFADDWELGKAVLDGSGKTVAADGACPAWHREAPDGPVIVGRDAACLQRHGWREVVYYQPESLFWRFQWTQAGVETAGAAVVAAFILVRVRRRAW